MRTRPMLAALLATAVLAGCQQPTPDLDARRSALLETDSAWQEAASAGEDLDLIVSFWTDDAIVYPPGQPALEGKAAIREYVAGALEIPGFEIAWETLDAELAASGDLAYLTHRNRITAPGPDGELVTTHGKGVTVWRWTEEGWKCVVDIWNASPDGEGSSSEQAS